MNTSVYIKPDDILFVAAGMAGDRDFKVIPKGFYLYLIQEAFEELAIDSFFQELRADFDFPNDNLTLPLPEGCFNIKNIYIFQGDQCDIINSRKVWWKRNYYTTGSGYIANDKGNDNGNDPFYPNHNFPREPAGVAVQNDGGVNSRLYYNIQMGNIMFSSACRGEGNRVHIHYNGTGCAIGEIPIIPVFLRQAMEDYLIEAALRFRMGNDPINARNWAYLQQTYERRLKKPYDGSWEKAIDRVKTMNSSQKEELSEYLSRGGWGRGR